MKKVREYQSYAAYLAHQPRKLKDCPAFIRGIRAKREERVAWFMDRFRELPRSLGVVLCLGARLGEEVEAFWRLGVPGAVGIDLVAHPPWVRVGDMNHLEIPDSSADMVYTNALDHCWDPKQFAAEILRVLKPKGIVAMHVAFGEGLYETWVPRVPDDVAILFPDCELLASRPTDPPAYSLDHEMILLK